MKKSQDIFLVKVVFALPLLLATVGCHNLSESNDNQSPEKPRSPSICSKIHFWKVAELNWSKEMPFNQGWANVESWFDKRSGPTRYPVKPELSLFSNLGNIVGLLTDKDSSDKLIRIDGNPHLTKLPSEQYYDLVPMNRNIIWIIQKDKIAIHNIAHSSTSFIKNPGGRGFLSINDHSGWLYGTSHAWFIHSNGNQVRGSWQWNGGRNSAVVGQSICQVTRSSSLRARLECLDKNGKRTSLDLNWIKGEVRGKLLSFQNEVLLTGDTKSLYQYKKDGSTTTINITNAGLTDTGEAFLSTKIDDDWTDICLSKNNHRRLFTKATGNSPLYRSLAPISVTNTQVIAYGWGQAAYYKDDLIEKRVRVDNDVYKTQIFPYSWEITSPERSFTLQSSEQAGLLSSSGPTGIIIIGVKFKD